MTDTLLSRLQSLTEGSREIDAEIALANGWTRGEYSTSHAEPFWFSPDGQQIWRQPPRYTESLDAVLPLLNGRNCVLNLMNGRGLAEARVGGMPGEGFVIKSGEHKIPAIALLIAIMKAKEHSKP